MKLNWPEKLKKLEIPMLGIVHIGAHFGQEIDLYKQLGFSRVVFIEAHPNTFMFLMHKMRLYSQLNKGLFIQVLNYAIGNQSDAIVTLNTETANQGQSNSLLKPKKHLDQYPEIVFTGEVQTLMMRLDDIWINILSANILLIDVQGAEKMVLEGAQESLKHFDAIITEVNFDELYENCPTVSELDEMLAKHNFMRIATSDEGKLWGDALYVKKSY